MLFNSLNFLIFFPIVVTASYMMPPHYRWVLLLAASGYFYMAFVPVYIALLLALIGIGFILAISIEAAAGNKRKLLFWLAIAVNLGILFVFKYFDFFAANISRVASLLHWNYSLQALELLLPLGLSFQVFQNLAYVIDVYFKRVAAERHVGYYMLYVLFFPQLVAGPIGRPKDLLPQFRALGGFDERRVIDGLRLMLWGFFKKLVVADKIGFIVDSVYGNPAVAPGWALAMAAGGFVIQLYADFSGYSDIARGSARVLGVELAQNFDTPLFATSIADFWRRWHMSLSTWFRDYFYYPLALSLAKRSKVGLYASILITFVTIGVWHGAGWNYVIFGAVFGLYVVAGTVTKNFRSRIVESLKIPKNNTWHSAAQMLMTFCLVALGFVFFKAGSMSNSIAILGGVVMPQRWQMSNPNSVVPWLSVLDVSILCVGCLVMLFGEFLVREKYVQIDKVMDSSPRWLRWSGYYALILSIVLVGYDRQRTFIYFQF